MDSDSVCEAISKLLADVELGEGTPELVEEIRALVDQWDEFASWGDDR